MDVTDLTPRDLRAFLACVEAGSLTRAAVELGLPQPTLSHAVARVEACAGTTLLLRRRRREGGLAVTEAGAAVAARARRVLGELHALAEDLGGDHAGGELRVGAIQSLHLTLLPKILAGFLAAHPQTRVIARTDDAPGIIADLRRGALDLGLIAGPVPASAQRLRLEHVRDEPYEAVLRRDDPLAKFVRLPLRRLASRDLLLPPEDSATGSAVRAACRAAGFEPRVRLSLASGEGLRELVRAGVGITVLPEGYLPPGDPDLMAVPFAAGMPSRAVLCLSDPAAPATRALDLLRAAIGAIAT